MNWIGKVDWSLGRPQERGTWSGEWKDRLELREAVKKELVFVKGPAIMPCGECATTARQHARRHHRFQSR
jgi:hypothetical protein